MAMSVRVHGEILSAPFVVECYSYSLGNVGDVEFDLQYPLYITYTSSGLDILTNIYPRILKVVCGAQAICKWQGGKKERGRNLKSAAGIRIIE